MEKSRPQRTASRYWERQLVFLILKHRNACRRLNRPNLFLTISLTCHHYKLPCSSCDIVLAPGFSSCSEPSLPPAPGKPLGPMTTKSEPPLRRYSERRNLVTVSGGKLRCAWQLVASASAVHAATASRHTLARLQTAYGTSQQTLPSWVMLRKPGQITRRTPPQHAASTGA